MGADLLETPHAHVTDVLLENGLDRRPHPTHPGDGGHRVVERQPVLDDAVDAVVEGALPDPAQPHQIRHRVVLALDGHPVELVEVLEVAKDAAMGDAGPLGDRRHRRLEIPLAVQVEQRVDDPITVLVPPGPSSVDADHAVGAHRCPGAM